MRKRLIVARFARLLFENRRRRRRVVSLRVRASLYPVVLLREEQIKAAPAERRRRRGRRSRRRAMITAATAKIIILRDGSMHHRRRRRRQRGSSIARSSRPLYRLSEHFCFLDVVGSSKRFFDDFCFDEKKRIPRFFGLLAPFLRHFLILLHVYNIKITTNNPTTIQREE
jgi:hypothetical protein